MLLRLVLGPPFHSISLHNSERNKFSTFRSSTGVFGCAGFPIHWCDASAHSSTSHRGSCSTSHRGSCICNGSCRYCSDTTITRRRPKSGPATHVGAYRGTTEASSGGHPGTGSHTGTCGNCGTSRASRAAFNASASSGQCGPLAVSRGRWRQAGATKRWRCSRAAGRSWKEVYLGLAGGEWLGMVFRDG